MRFFVRRKETTCKITDNASKTNIPPTITKSNSFFINNATVPRAPPKAKEPTSPIKIEAG